MGGPDAEVTALDVVIFACLQSLGVFAIVGNASLIVVLLRNKYLNRASFILMLSLAIADVLHGLVTILHFYPPIVLKRVHVSELAVRIFNIVDWTAWAITLTHMSAICIDRLIAIGLYGRYNTIVTIPRVRNYTITCWTVFFLTNVVFFYTKVCCLIRPLKSQNYYSFGYIENEFNSYVLTYTPVEIITIAVLTVSNPITLYQLYKRHKRKVALRQQGAHKSCSDSTSSIMKQQRSQWQRFHSTITSPSRIVASTMLLEMSMKMGSKSITTDVREMAARRASRQQQRILLQISVVALIFYAYMTVYYVSYYSRYFKSMAAVIFNSFCYSFTHMINPVIYFTLNKEMRAQLKVALRDCGSCFRRRKDPYDFNHSSKIAQSSRTLAIEQTKASGTSFSETSPLFSSNNHYKATCETPFQDEEVPSGSAGAESAEIQAIVNAASDESDDYQTALDDIATNKMPPRDRSAFMAQLTNALQFSSKHSLHRVSGSNVKEEKTDRSFLEMPRATYMKMSATLQLIAKEPLDTCSPKFRSMTSLESRPLLDAVEEPSHSSEPRSSSTTSSADMMTSSNCHHILRDDYGYSDSDEDIAYL